MLCSFPPLPSPPLPPPGGINDLIVDMIKCCREQGIPLIFAMTRQHLGSLMRKKVPVSVVGIFSYDGAEVGAVQQGYGILAQTQLNNSTYQL